MKPFNLEEYLDEPSRRLVTREGGESRIRSVDIENVQYPITAIVDMGLYVSESFYTGRGKFFDDEHKSRFDLFFVPKKVEVGKYLKYLLTKFVFRIKYALKKKKLKRK